jgi:hypothetical protein
MTKTAQRKLETISFAYPANLMQDVKKALTKAGYDMKEEGSPKDSEGHCIEAFLDGEQMMFAIIHSNQQHYLLRAVNGLLT